ncbi:MAG: M23 family metallopeptidase [Salinarimonas sp.]|nr:M23 family metallopeptidase [Salinarimonas sp.]
MLFNLGTHIDIAGLDLPDIDIEEGFEPTPLAELAEGEGEISETGSLSRHPVRRPSPILSQRPRPAPLVSESTRRGDSATPDAPDKSPDALPPTPEDDAFSLRLRESRSSAPLPDHSSPQGAGGTEADSAATVNLAERLRAVEASLAQVEADQFMRLDAVNQSLAGATKKLRDVIVQTGLDPDALDPSGGEETGIGGPYLPIGIDPEGGPFEAMVWMLQENLTERERLHRATEQLPLARPASRQFSVSSGFGVRRDPFTGRPALHAGIDFRTPRGTPIRAAGAGRVVTAGRSGGYGNLVEIDHGNGVTTRYAHLSSIAVERGQIINTGDHLGRAGSTGRSTGPHLHYETRIDDEPVDPNRFLRAGRLLTQTKGD